MKSPFSFLAVSVLALATASFAQLQPAETSDAPIWVAGHAEWSQVLDNNTSSIGLRVAYMPSPLLSVGVWVSTLVVDASYTHQGIPRNLDYDLVGLFAEPVFFPSRKIHLTLPVRMGIGGLNYTEPGQEDSKSAGWFTVTDAGLFVEIPMSERIRPSLGGGVRMTHGARQQGLSDDDFRTAYAGMILKWGIYKD